MSKVKDVEKYELSENDLFILDTNIYMYLYLPNNEYEYVEKYAVFFEKLIYSGANTLITSIQISEFFNRYSRMRYDEYRKKNKSDITFKKYRDTTQDYMTVIRELNIIIQNQMLRGSKVVSDDFDEGSLKTILENEKPYDFNDEYLINLALVNKAKLITHDRDIIEAEKDIDVLTAL